MATAKDITVNSPTPLILDVSTTHQKLQWKQWINNLELYFTCSNIKESQQKRALLLYLGGDEMRKIHSTLEDDSGTTYETAKAALEEYFKTKINLTFERNNFRNITQHAGESAKTFITRMKEAVTNCNFNDYDDNAAVIDQFIEKTDNSKLRRRLLTEDALTLQKLLQIASNSEVAEIQASAIENTNQNEYMNKAQHEKYNNRNSRTNTQRQYEPDTTRKSYSSYTCYGCGNNGHPFASQECPASGKRCGHCGNINHFEKMCRIKKRAEQDHNNWRKDQNRNKWNNTSKKELNNLETESSDEEYIFKINGKADITINIDNHPVKFLRDSGASINAIDRETFQELQEKKKIKLYPTKTKIFTYNSNEPMELDGVFYSNANYQNNHHIAKIYVAANPNVVCILGRHSAVELGVMKLIEEINTLRTGDSEINSMMEDYKQIFQGLGKLKNTQIKFDIDETVKPVAQHLRRIPIYVIKKVEKKIEELIKIDVIEKVRDSTSWISPIVAVPKGEDVRITIDMRKANQAIRRNHHPVPTLEELLSRFNGCRWFSKVDLNHGYHQIELHPESRYITAFVTHSGVYQYKRLVQGATCAQQDYQYYISKLFMQEELIENICDDILVAGRTKDEHNKNLKRCLQILKENNLTVNSKKCIWGAPEVTFYGHTISAKGIKPTAGRIKAVKEFSEPKNPKEVSSFLGLVNYLGTFINNLATITAPLRNLLKKDVEWKWGKEEENTFAELKNIVSSDLCVEHFYQSRETFLITDAGPIGLGAILAQKQENGEVKPVAYASRSLTRQEQKYSQTEREALGVVWACERFHLYIYGSPFKILSDHQPLKVLYSHQGKPSPRVLRWGLRMQSYDFHIEHIPGNTNPADILSIKPSPHTGEKNEETEEYINSVIAYAIPKAISLSEIIKQSEEDEVIQEVIKSIKENEWNTKDKEVKEYQKIQSELSFKAGILLKGERIIIPNNLRKRTLKLAHETHLGMVKTKALIRDKVWWPGINKQIEDMLHNCIPCLSMGTTKTEPMKHNNIPIGKPWEKIHLDLCGPYPTGDYVVGLIDACTRWPDLYTTTSTTSKSITKYLLQSFATHGFPEVIVTDNAPNLVSADIKEFCNTYSIKHQKATPYWPQGNSEIERFYQTLSKFVKTTTSEGRSWKNEIHNFLLLYRNTPHCTTKISPAKLLMNRTLRDKIPSISYKESKLMKEVRKTDEMNKRKSKPYYDQRKNTKPPIIEEGDWAIIKQKKKGKLLTRFETNPIKIIKVRGSAVTAMRNGKEVTRNSSEFKKIKQPEKIQEYKESSEDELDYQYVTYDKIPRNDEEKENATQTNTEETNNEGEETKDNKNKDEVIEERNRDETKGNSGDSEDKSDNSDDEEIDEDDDKGNDGDDEDIEEREENEDERTLIEYDNSVQPIRNQNVKYMKKESDEWISAKIMSSQPKKGGKWGHWINIRNEGEDPICVDWNSIKKWYCVN